MAIESLSIEIARLRDREAKIKRRIREMQTRDKQVERKRRSARLVRWGVVVEALLKAGEIGEQEWLDTCRRILTKHDDFEVATDVFRTSSQSEAHLNVSLPSSEKQRAPAAGESEAGNGNFSSHS